MTSHAALDAPTATAPPPTPAAPPTAGPPPAITPNRRRLERRFPVLAFSVRTHGRPWFEVLLTTDRTLFDPANAARRTSGTFYAGRQDGGLARATADETAYVVPAAVLRRFLSTVPRPAEVFYTVAAYDAPDGPPVLAQPVGVLASTAPSIAVGRDVSAQAMAVVLGVPADKLQPVEGAAPPPVLEPDPVTGLAMTWSSEDDDAAAVDHASAAWFDDVHALALDDATAALAEDDAAADEEPWAGGAAHAALGDHDDGPGPVAAGPDEAIAYGDDAFAYGDEDLADGDEAFAYGDEDLDEGLGEASAEEPPRDDEPVREPSEELGAEGFDYDDGFGEAQSDDDPAWAEAAERSWPAGAAEPEQLADADDALLDDELAAGAEDLEPYDEAPGPVEDLDLEPEHDPSADGAVASALETPLDIPAKIAIVTKIGRLFESSAGYAGINADTEFSNPRLPQHGRWHVGLSYGFIQFTQDSGALGQLLRLMRERDPATFREVFGPDADTLVAVTTRSGPSGRQVPGGRSARVQPVGGADLWQEPWLSRFRAAGAHPPFQAAQNELAVRRHVDPLLPYAGGFGLDTERALAMVVDRGIQMGIGGARRWLTEAIGPVRTDAQRQQALGALGLPDLAAFQRAAGLRRDGDFGPVTHAAMVGALRRLGAASPIPIPTRDQLMDQVVARADAAGVPWRRRPRTIRTSAEFADAPLSWPAPAPAR